MKKIIFGGFVLVVLLAVGGYLVRPSAPSASAEKKVVVVASGYVPYTLANELGGKEISLQMLLPPNAEPHSFEPTPGDLVALHNAQVFVYISDTLEPWVKDVLGAAQKDTRIVPLGAGIASSDDPHVWMDFDNVRRMARTLVDALVAADPQHAGMYQQNLARFEQKIMELDHAFSQELAVCQSREVVHIGHLAFSLLAKRYRLTLSSLAGASHDGEHSVRKLADLVKHIRARRITSVFTEEAVSPRLAQTVAVETGAALLPLYTIEHVSKEDFNRKVTYAQLMYRNLASLKQGLVCPAL